MAVLPFTTSTSYPLFGVNVGPFGTVWPYELQADVQVWLTVPPAAARLLTNGPDYTIADVHPIADGGLVTLDALLPGAGWSAGAVLNIRRATANDQPSSFGEALGFSPQASEAALDHVERQLQDLRTAILLGGGGGGGGGGASDWSQITNIPAVWPGQVQWSSITGRPGAWPGTLPFGSLTAVPAAWPGSLPYGSLTGVPTLIDVIDSLVPAAGKIIEFTGAGAAHLINTPAGGGGGAMQPAELSTFGAVDATGANPATNDPVIAAAELAADSAIYLRDGMYAKSAVVPPFSNLTKGYRGRGKWKEGTSIVPAQFSYMAAKPTTAATQGLTGWFDGDQRFTDQDYKIIGAGVRTFDLTQRYYESNVIPKNSWLDVLSGSSGAQALLKSGAAAGATVIALPFAADASWVGKTVGFNNSYGGTVLETHVVSAVNTAGNNITLATPLVNTYTWNPPVTMPTLVFGPRTWAGHDYLKMTSNGGGDHYGHNVRMNANYVPKATETHPFMAGTFSQYGGDVTANADGIYLQSWESQIQGGVYDIWSMSFVQSMVRNVDAKLDSRFWGGTWLQSGGTKPIDSFHTVLGPGRVGMDMVFATLIETGTLAAQFTAGTATLTGVSVNGAHPKDTVTIGAETLIINSVNAGAKQITFTTNAANTYAIGTPYTLNAGGAALNLALGQRIVWNSSLSASERGADFNGVFSTPYGNKQGDLIMGSGNDGTDYWQVRFADGGSNATPDSGRIRLRRGGVQIFGTGNHSVAGTGFNLAAGCNFSIATGQLAILGTGCYLFSDGNHVYATSPSGTVTIV